MNTAKKVMVYLVGFMLGLVIVSMWSKNRPQREAHPWHAQTAPEGYYPLQVTDFHGRRLTFERQPRWFISMAPSITEILFAMNMGDHLMAVTDFCDYPEQARVLRSAGRSIGRMDQPDFEQFAVLRPDLILATDLTPPEVLARLHQPPRIIAAGLRHQSLDGLFAEIAFIGRITGVPSFAGNLLRDLRARRQSVEQALLPFRGQAPRRALILLAMEDTLQPGWSPGKDTWPDDLLQIVHAENPARSLGQSWGQVSLEALLTLNPEVLLVSVDSTEQARQRFQRQLVGMQTHPIWRQVDAVRNERVIAVPSEDMNIPGPRMLNVLEVFARGVWPEAFEQEP